MKQISLRMLKKVLSIQSKSTVYRYKEEEEKDSDLEMRRYIKSVLSSEGIRHFEDKYSNIYAVKGKADLYDCIVSHIDTVHSVNKDAVVKQEGDYLYAFDPIAVKQVGIGGDDKVGVYIALQTLKDRDNIKSVFYRNEEVGKLGSRFSAKNNIGFYKNCKYIIQNDRRENDDFIYKSGGINICSNNFRKDCSKIISKYGYKEEEGLTSDVDTLVREGVGISAVNLSCGYFRPHSDKEIVSISDVENAYNMTNEIFDKLQGKYEHKYAPPVYSSKKNKSNKKDYQFSFSSKFNDSVYTPLNFTEYKTEYTDIDIVKDKHLELFYKLKYKDFYILKDDKEIHIPKYKCDKCGNNSTTYFIPDENKFFCIGCNDYIGKWKSLKYLERMLILKDSGHLFYHNSIVNRWIKDNAVWDDKYKMYRHRNSKDI